MDWREIYKSRQCTALEAVSLIKSGDRVAFSEAAGEPSTLVEAMVANAAAYRNVTVSHMVTVSRGLYSHPEYKENFRWEGWFAGPTTMKSLEQGHGDFVPVCFSKIPKMIREGYFPIDVYMVQVAPPNEHGYCSLGVTVDYAYEGVKSGKIVLAEVNDQMPVTYGDTWVHVSELDRIVLTSRPLNELKSAETGPVEEAIGKYCATLIEDGSTIQLGIGAIPEAVCAQLKDKKHLGVHSGMISDGLLDLVEAGVIDCSEKSIDKDKMVAAVLWGTKRLYDFASQNPMVEMRTSDYVHSIPVIAQNKKFIAINSCVQVDFMGQVVAESIGTKQISGVGGQLDFVRGANESLDCQGKAIIAMPSTVFKQDGSMFSKIVPFIDHGAPVTVSRMDVDYIVTEYGIASLKGKNLKDRARQLINIAHPDAREKLMAAFRERYKAEF